MTIKSADRALPFISDPNHRRLLLRIIANIDNLQKQISSGDIVSSSSSSSSGGGSDAFDLLDTTFGNLIVADGSAFDVLGVGDDDQYLSADSAEALGVKWKTPTPGGGLTYLGEISGGTTATLGEITGIPSDAVRIICAIEDISLNITSGSGEFQLFPADSASYSITSDGTGTYISGSAGSAAWTSNTGAMFGSPGTGAHQLPHSGTVTFTKIIGTNDWSVEGSIGRTNTSTVIYYCGGLVSLSGALDRIKCIIGGSASPGTFHGGKISVYCEREALSVSNGAGEFYIGTIAVGSGASSAELTGIPASVIALKLVCSDLYVNSNDVLLDLASSASYGETCAGSATYVSTTVGGKSWTSGSGGQVCWSGSGSYPHYGEINLRRMVGTNDWIVSSTLGRDFSSNFITFTAGGRFSLSAALDRLKVKTSSGTFGGAGSIDVYGEYEAVGTGGLVHLGDMSSTGSATLGEVTGIPATATKIILSVDSVQGNVSSGSGMLTLLFGDSASYSTENEYGIYNYDAGSTSENSSFQTGAGGGVEIFQMGSGGSGIKHSGTFELVRVFGSNTWTITGFLAREGTTAFMFRVIGRITLTNELDRVKMIFQAGGSPGTFSGGTVSVYCI